MQPSRLYQFAILKLVQPRVVVFGSGKGSGWGGWRTLPDLSASTTATATLTHPSPGACPVSGAGCSGYISQNLFII